MSGSLLNRVRQGEPCCRGGRSPRGFSRRLRAHTGLGAWRPRRQHGEKVVWGEQASRVTKPAAHRTCRAPRSEVPSSVARPSDVCRAGTRDQHEREASAPYTGSGDNHRASEARSQPTRGRYPYVRDQVQCSSGEKRERQEKTKKCSKGLDNCGHIEGLKEGSDIQVAPLITVCSASN